MLFVSLNSFACVEQNRSANDKFLAAVKMADFVYIGSVIRVYRLPSTYDPDADFNAFVFDIKERIAGNTLTHMEVEQQSICGISPENDKHYWPQDLGGEYVVAGTRRNGINYVNGLMPVATALPILYDITSISRANIKD